MKMHLVLNAANEYGLRKKGIKSFDELTNLKDKLINGDIKAIVSFGDDLSGIDLEKVEFKAVMGIYMPDGKFDVVLPAASYFETCGTFAHSNADDSIDLRVVNMVIDPISGYNNSEILDKLCKGY